MFAKDYDVSFIPCPGIQISDGDISFVVERLCYHVDKDAFSCQTRITAKPERSYDEIVDYYEEHGYSIRALTQGL